MTSPPQSAPACLAEQLISRIRSRTARIGVMGLGYVGLPLALLFSEEQFTVTGFDTDERKIQILQSGESYIQRISATEVRTARKQGMAVTRDTSLLAALDVVVICVPTPLSDFREPDLQHVVATAQAIALNLRPGQLVVLQSTTYPGTTEDVLRPILEKNLSGLQARGDGNGAPRFFLAFSPEREDPGNTAIARRDIPKVVAGVDTASTEVVVALYETIFRRVVAVSTPAAAEMTKLLENIYRCVNIALVNELKLLSLRMGIDIWEVIEAAATKPFGFQPFYPGPGLGGHCIPVDPFYLAWKARQFDFHARFIELAGEINTIMPYHVVRSVGAALNAASKALNGARILVLGVAYKKDVDDLRESPALVIIELLQKEGAMVAYNDPHVPFVGRGRKYDLQMSSTPLDELCDYDCTVIVTDHSEYDYQGIVRGSRLVVDTRNATRGIESSKVVHC